MIKGSLDERLEYEEYIRSLKDNVIPELLPFDNIRRVVRRYYEIRAAKEKRPMDVNEIRVANLMTLLGCAIKFAGVVYTWLWNEFIPRKIIDIPQCDVEWNVSDDELANIFMEVSDKCVEATLLKANAPRAIISNVLGAKQKKDIETIGSQLSVIPLENLFGSYKYLSSVIQLTGKSLSYSGFNVKDFYGKFRYALNDIKEGIGSRSLGENANVEKIVAFAQSLDLNEEGLLLHSKDYIFDLYVCLINIYAIFEYNIGAFDPIPQTMAEILEIKPYKNIAKMYFKFPRDEERYDATLKKMLNKWNELIGTEWSFEGSPIIKLEDLNSRISNNVHLDFPSRLMNNTASNRIFTHSHSPILKEIFNVYGNMFENMTCEDFVYLFGGSKITPATYNPPFYWTGEESTFKAIIKVLYMPQPRGLRRLVLSSSDRAEGKTEHDWGRNKDKVAYLDVENNIREIVKDVAKVDLTPL